ncbi:hypothetical protein AGDE_08271 [Angomonas deanei]|nr:hypothetical protein AGDE_08271 [Angomonas deanei]|eukprot:EPY33463.1 hypothetical protein AGDE_08271 [Angomonas deanei]
MWLDLQRSRSIAEREMPCTNTQRSLTSLKCFFENEVLEDETLTVDDEDFPHNAPSEKLLQKDLIMRGDGAAVNRAVSSICFGDPLQVYEKMIGAPTGGKDKEEAEEEESADVPSYKNVWVANVETKKPIPALKTFTGGSVICVKAERLSSNVSKIHGVGTDPLIIAGAFYCIEDNRKTKVSETFYFDSALDIFYPQKERKELAKDNKVVAFIPSEFRGSLHFVIRVFRPCTEDFDNYVDLYQRTDKYKPVHVAPMKQDSLLLAQNSDVFEELGWNFAVVDPKKN